MKTDICFYLGCILNIWQLQKNTKNICCHYLCQGYSVRSSIKYRLSSGCTCINQYLCGFSELLQNWFSQPNVKRYSNQFDYNDFYFKSNPASWNGSARTRYIRHVGGWRSKRLLKTFASLCRFIFFYFFLLICAPKCQSSRTFLVFQKKLNAVFQLFVNISKPITYWNPKHWVSW